jgi:hypothetical protein
MGVRPLYDLHKFLPFNTSISEFPRLVVSSVLTRMGHPLKYQYSFSAALPSNRAYFFKTSRYQFMFFFFVLSLMSLPDVRQRSSSAAAEGSPLDQ